MSWAQNVLTEYGRSLGLPALDFNSSGVASLRFERLGDLFFEQIDDHVLIYLARQHDRIDAGMLKTAMTLCHWDDNPAFPVNTALHGDRTLVFSTTLEEAELDVPTLEHVISALDTFHNRTQEGSNL